jgi:outer membrane protein TolC
MKGILKLDSTIGAYREALQPDAEFSIPVAAFEAALPAIPVGVPSELLERRPDIAAAERAVAQANAQIG